MKLGTPGTSKTLFSHWRGCIFKGFQLSGTHTENYSQTPPKITPKSKKKWSQNLLNKCPQQMLQKGHHFFNKNWIDTSKWGPLGSQDIHENPDFRENRQLVVAKQKLACTQTARFLRCAKIRHRCSQRQFFFTQSAILRA